MRDCAVEIGRRLVFSLDSLDHAVESAEAVDFIRVADFGAVKRVAQDAERFVVGLEGHRERVAVFAAEREGEARRIAESRRRAMDHFGHKRQRLERSRPEIFGKQERGEVAQIALVTDGEDCAEPFEIDVFCANPMMVRHSGVRLAGKIANRGGMPVVAPRKAGGVVHSLLHNGPFAGGRHDEGVEIELEAVADSIVVDLRGEAAAADERVAGDSRAVGNGT